MTPTKFQHAENQPFLNPEFWHGPTLRLCKVSYFPDRQHSEIYAVQTNNKGVPERFKLLSEIRGRRV